MTLAQAADQAHWAVTMQIIGWCELAVYLTAVGTIAGVILLAIVRHTP